eukprot:1535566-Alexandrium_andersonii.AAC.1
MSASLVGSEMCIRDRRRPDVDCWDKVVIDMEGPSTPADRDGNEHVLTCPCFLRRGVLLEPC